MKTKTLVIAGLIVVFAVGVAIALLREVSREEATLAQTINGVVDVDPQLVASGQADIVRTDRLVLMLVDPATREPVALKFISPLVPPQTIRIGQQDARGQAPLKGPYLMVGITDKDGEIYKITPGEVYGRSPEPVALGTEQYKLVLNEPFHGSLFNEAAAAQTGPHPGGPPPGMPGGAPAGQGPMMRSAGPITGPEDVDPRYSVAGTITVTKEMASNVAPSDRLIILLFDPQQARPVAFKIIPHTLLPQRFTLTLPPEAQADPKPAYDLRVFTDKDNNPFNPAPGELAGRSEKPIPLGTMDIDFKLNEPYKH